MHVMLVVQVVELHLSCVRAGAGCADYCMAAEVVDCLGFGAHLGYGVGWKLDDLPVEC